MTNGVKFGGKKAPNLAERIALAGRIALQVVVSLTDGDVFPFFDTSTVVMLV